MQRKSKSRNEALHSGSAIHSYQEKNQSQTIEAGIAASNAILQDPPAIELSAGEAAREVTIEERYQLVAEAAYYRAERRNFTPGNELADWLDAETEIENKFSRMR